MKTQTRSLLALFCTVAASLLSQTVCGQIPTPTPVITFTEINNTTLTAVYTNGSGVSTNLTVVPQGVPDAWAVLEGAGIVPTPAIVNWFEPGSNSFRNHIDGSPGVAFSVFSDLAIPPGSDTSSFLANNTRSSFAIATDFSNPNSPVSVYGIFNDLGDVASAPDTGSTFGLLALALAALFGASRLRSIRLA